MIIFMLLFSVNLAHTVSDGEIYRDRKSGTSSKSLSE